MNDGSLFADNSSLYLYGGGISVAYPAIGAPTVLPPDGVWQYDLGSGQWSMAALSGVPVNRSIIGMSAQSFTTSVAYYLSGVKEPASDPYFWTLPSATPYMDQGLLWFEEGSLTIKNYSTTGLNEYGTAAAGFMVLIESIGSHGVLVAFGGISNPPGKPMNVTDEYDASLQWNLSSVSVYDIGGQAWYQQTTAGDIPRWRYSGCSVVVSAPDQSSHSIYVFGGWGDSFGESDGGVYVLLIPSFQWIRVNTESNERSRHHCSLIGNNTMLVVGGITPSYNNPRPYDPSGCDTTAMFSQGLGMFSLNNHSWSTNYDPVAAASPYQIHPNIASVIGGNANGGATAMNPERGFSTKALGVLLTGNQNVVTFESSTGSTPSTTPKPVATPKHKMALSVGSIAGIVASCVFGLAVGMALVLILYLRRRQSSNQFQATEMSDQIARFELPDSRDKVFELGATEKPLPATPDEKGFRELEGHQWVPEIIGHDATDR
ncbi:MAG: hypothetical protein Q9175_002236 [Cornicularia normoerica]